MACFTLITGCGIDSSDSPAGSGSGVDVPLADGKSDDAGKSLRLFSHGTMSLYDYAQLSAAQRRERGAALYSVIADSNDKLMIGVPQLLVTAQLPGRCSNGTACVSNADCGTGNACAHSWEGVGVVDVTAESPESNVGVGLVLLNQYDEAGNFRYVACGGTTVYTSLLIDVPAHEITVDHNKTYSFDDCDVKTDGTGGDFAEWVFSVSPVPHTYRGLLAPGDRPFHVQARFVD